MKRNMILNVSVAVAVFCTAAIGAMSFKKGGDKAVKADTIYEYDSNSTAEGEFAKTANWEVVSTSPSCAISGTRPCSIVVHSGSSLGAQIGGKTNAQILALPLMERKP